MKTVKSLSVMLVFCMITLLISGWSSRCYAAAVQTEAKETVAQAYQKLQNLKNYHITLDTANSLTAQGKAIHTVTKGEFDIQVNPLLCKSDLEITTNINSNQINQKIEQYIEDSGNRIILYSNAGNKWKRKFLPKGSYNPLRDYENYIKAIKSVTIKSEDADSTVFEVVADGNYLKEDVRRNLTALGMSKLKLSDDFLKENMDDLSYQVTIAKKQGTISMIDIDQSNFIHQLGNHLAEAMPLQGDQKKIMKEMFNSMKMVMHMTLSQFDNVEPFTVPQEARDVDLPMMS